MNSQGVQAPEGNYQSFAQVNNDLPSSFLELAQIFQRPALTDVATYNQSMLLYEQAEKALFSPSKKNKEEDAIKLLLKAGKNLPSLSEYNNNRLLVAINKKLSDCYQTVGLPKLANDHLQKSIQYSIATNHFNEAEGLGRNLAYSHIQNGTIEQYKTEQEKLLTNSLNKEQRLQAAFELGGINRIQNNHEKPIGCYTQAYNLTQKKIDYDAHVVNQHEVGFSDKDKLGTG